MEESSEGQTHAGRVRRGKKASLKLPPDSKYDWPANHAELLGWYSNEVTDVSRAAQLRIQEATKIIADCTRREIGLEEAAERVGNYNSRWGDAFHGGVDRVRGMSDEEIYKAMDDRREKRIREARERRDKMER